MAYLRIVPGIGSLTDAGRVLSSDVYKISDDLSHL